MLLAASSAPLPTQVRVMVFWSWLIVVARVGEMTFTSKTQLLVLSQQSVATHLNRNVDAAAAPYQGRRVEQTCQGQRQLKNRP